ncbi:MAG TPA: nuclear transport factor 2 family protein [Candidatus Angelobacter sp.]|nr:nuclear transport factor 2 family protein [Candidatus Angelobacter sp.]
MRQLLTLVLLFTSSLVLAQTSNPQEPSGVIIAQENAFWTAYVQGNTADLSSLLLPDFTSVEQEIWNRDQVLGFVKMFHANCTLAPVKILNPHVKFLTGDIAMLVYHAIETPTCGTRTMSGDTNISSVWVRRDGQWKLQLHTEYAIPGK